MMEHLVNNPWWWLGLAVLLGIGEVLTPGIFLIWISLAAAATGFIALLLNVPLAVQFMFFAAFCLLSVWAGRRWYAKNPVISQDPLLNDRIARMVGEIVIVAEPITHGKGRVRVGDSIWDASGEDMEAGVAVRIIGARGSVLMVEPA